MGVWVSFFLLFKCFAVLRVSEPYFSSSSSVVSLSWCFGSDFVIIIFVIVIMVVSVVTVVLYVAYWHVD